MKNVKIISVVIGVAALAAIIYFAVLIDNQGLNNGPYVQNTVESEYKSYLDKIPDEIIKFTRQFHDGDITSWHDLADNIVGITISEAEIRRYDNKSKIFILSESTPSGDWFKTTHYYFNDDGAIAYLTSTLNTFYGNVSVLTRQKYSDNGDVMEKTIEIRDLDTNEISENSYQENPPETILSLDGIYEFLAIEPR